MNDSLLPSRPLRVFSAFANALWWLLLAFWLVLVLAWGGLHAWIVPRVGELRPQLEAQATRALGIAVRIGSVSAYSDGLVPTFELRDVVLLDAQAREALRLARVVVTLSPRSLWSLGFDQLHIEGPMLDVRRTPDGRLWVAGFDVSRGGGDERFADWVLRQREVVVSGGALRWTDEMSGAPPLTLRALELVNRNGLRRHDLRLSGTPAEGQGGRFTLVGMFRQPIFSNHPGRWQDWSGQLHADFSSVDLSLLARQSTLGVRLQGGRGSLRAWLDLDNGRFTGGAVDVALQDLAATLAQGRPPLALRLVSGRLAGKWAPQAFELETRDLRLQLAEGPVLNGVNLALSWADTVGRQSAQGRISAARLDLASIGRVASHLPVNDRLLELVQRHAPQGVAESFQASWQGPLEQPRTYSARGLVSALALASAQGQPGISGAAVEFDFTEAGGKARVQVRDGAVDLPGVLEDPRVPLRLLSGEVQWKRGPARTSLEVKGLEFANADVQGGGHLSWHSGDTARGGLPGVLDLQLELARANGTRVWRYLPVGVPQETRDYVREAVLAGSASEGRIRVRGDLRDFPFADPRSGDFRISAKVRDAHFVYVPHAPADGHWPALTGLSGELIFERNAMRVVGAQGRVAGAPTLQVQADAAIANLSASTVQVTGLVRGPLADSLAVFNSLPVSRALDRPLAGATATGMADVRLALSLPVAQIDRSRVQGSVTLAGNDLQLVPDAPLLQRARGVVSFSESGFTVNGAQARALGGDLRIDGGLRSLPAGSSEPPMLLRVQGTATAEGLRQARELGWLSGLARRASGGAAYSATLGLRPTGVDIAVTSSLQGLALDLPAPLNKPAETSLPVRFVMAPVPGASAQDQLSVEVGRVASLTYVRDTRGAQARVVSGAIGVGLVPGESAPLPERGVQANINLAAVNVDAWEAALEGLVAPGPQTPSPGAALAAAQGYLPTLMAVRARELTLQGRTLHEVVMGGSRDGLTWRANVDATELNGYVEYRQPAGSGASRLIARLARLSIAESSTSEVESLLDAQPSSIPALDVVVDNFELRGRQLGRLEIEAVNRGATGGTPPEWRLNRLGLTMPEAQFSATGNWAALGAQARTGARPDRRRTVMNFHLDVADSGQLLSRLGMKDVVRRGKGRLEGQVAWVGSPLALDYPSLNGTMAVSIESGQFLKADPGLSKLLGVLSLQSLPRRLTLDFRDVFTEGFTFDFMRGDMVVTQGILFTNNLQMKGVNAAVAMEGRADLARETQDLRVVVVPEINAGTASLVAAVINPAIGLGTFLAQLFLREPLARAATQEFHIDGTWADPRVTRLDRRPAQAVPGTATQGGN